MNDKILIKSGNYDNRETMPQLAECELAFQNDEKALYIGTPYGNLVLCRADDIEKLDNQEQRIAELEELTAQLENSIKETTARLDALEAQSE